MARELYNKGRHFYRHLAVSDESWFTLSGHVFNRKTVVNWKQDRSGSPEKWYTELKQGERKIMVFSVMHGWGKLFGPYFLPQGMTFNSQSYHRMLTEDVFPHMLEELGVEEFFQTVWQQVCKI